MNDKETIQQFLSQFPRQIDGLVYLYLHSISQERMVQKSGHTQSKQKGIYLTTFFHILYRLEQQQVIRLVKDNNSNSNSNLIITLLLDITEHSEMRGLNVTFQTDNVTTSAGNVTFQTDNVTTGSALIAFQDEIMAANPEETATTKSFLRVSRPKKTILDSANGNNDTEGDNMERQKKSKEKNPPAPPKKEIKRKNSHQHARVSQQALELWKKRHSSTVLLPSLHATVKRCSMTSLTTGQNLTAHSPACVLE